MVRMCKCIFCHYSLGFDLCLPGNLFQEDPNQSQEICNGANFTVTLIVLKSSSKRLTGTNWNIKYVSSHKSYLRHPLCQHILTCYLWNPLLREFSYIRIQNWFSDCSDDTSVTIVRILNWQQHTCRKQQMKFTLNPSTIRDSNHWPSARTASYLSPHHVFLHAQTVPGMYLYSRIDACIC